MYKQNIIKPVETIKTDIELMMLKKTFTQTIEIKEHHNHKDEIVIYWNIQDVFDENFKDSRTLRLNKKEIPKFIKALEKFQN